MKKITKRLLTAILTGTMIFSLGAIPTFAAQGQDGQIIITNPSTDVTYNAYKIFDLDYSGDNYAYTIKRDSDFFSTVQTYSNASDTTDADGLTLTQIGTSEVYNVTIDTSKFSAADFGSTLKSAVNSSMTPAATESDNTTQKDLSLTPTTLPYGYYLVTGTNSDGLLESLVSLDSTNKEAHIIEKNSTPGWHSEDPENPDDAKGKTIKITENGQDKYVETTDVSIGQQVTFAIRIDAKDYIEDNLIKSYVIKDSLPEGFTFGSITSVKVDNQSLTEYTDNNFPKGSIEIPWATEGTDGYWTSKYAPSTVITIEYTATLNSDAVIDGTGNENKATFTYTYGAAPDNPDPDTPPTIPDDPSKWTHSDSATVYTYAIALKKVNKNGKELSGAEFSLPSGMKVSEVAGKTNTYIVDSSGTITSITTNTTNGADASFTIIGVAGGEYEFTETKAPEGYNQLASPVSVTAQLVSKIATMTDKTFYLNEKGEVVEGPTTTTVKYTNNDYAVTPVAVVNLTGTELPSTGGMGTTIFYVVGAILVIGAGVILIARRRMSAR